MQLRRILVTPGLGGWYCDDKAAIVAGAEPDGYTFRGEPRTPGFRQVREPGEALLFWMETEAGATGCGDGTTVTYSGGQGREPVLRAAEQQAFLEQVVFPQFLGRDWPTFKEAAAGLEAWRHEGQPLSAAVRYGLSQAFLTALAQERNVTVTELLCEEYGFSLPEHPVPIGIQCGEDRYHGADKAILKRADVLPHALINRVEQLGAGGENLREYVRWLVQRVRELGGADYRPTLHLDVYGTFGRAFAEDVEAIADYIVTLEETAQPYPLEIEAPLELETRERQIEAFVRLRAALRARGSAARLIADEWCNTLTDVRAFVSAGACDLVQIKMPDLGSVSQSVEAALLCRAAGVGAYLGGSCNETDLSARLAVHVALATQAEQLLARPGMGVDEGLMIVRNEMARTLAVLRTRLPVLTPAAAPDPAIRRGSTGPR